jgi:hypothetical protein
MSRSHRPARIRRAHTGSIFFESLENRLMLAAQPYAWTNAAIGAGGFVDGIFYSPHQQNVIYARTDIGGLYRTTNDGQNWQQLLDFVGNNQSNSGNSTNAQMLGVLSFAIDPQNPNNLYADVGEYNNQNGWVLYSTDGGQTWGQTPLSFYVGGNSNGRGDGEQIAVDPNDSNILFLGSNSGGLWESTNAGHTFFQVTNFSPTSTTFVMFDPSSGTTGNPSQTIYAGVNSTSAGTNLYQSLDGGVTWGQVGGTGALPTGFLPGHAVLSGGNMYLGYANAEAPTGSITNGGVYRYTPSTGVWASISPIATNGHFGYDGVAADAQNPNTIVVTSFDYYSGPDQIWRTVDANDATPVWTELYDYSLSQNSGYGGLNPTRDTSNAPWIALFGDGISNWAAAVAINPFNSNQLMYGTGQGIWATNNASNGGANTQLTSAGSWYFPDTGIEFTAALQVQAPGSGVPLLSALGDINGFAHTTLTSSPLGGATVAGGALGTDNSIDFAGLNPNIQALVGTGSQHGAYSTNDGATWTEFATRPGSGGEIAVSADGASFVWLPSGKTPYYSTNDGTTWTASTMPSGTATGGQIIADRINPGTFYLYAGGTIYVSTNSGVSFSAAAAVAGVSSIAVNPFVAGDLWVATSAGIQHSTNFGASFSPVAPATVTYGGLIALGAPAPGKTAAAIYIGGTIGGIMGIYRSDDSGTTWIRVNDVNHQWGGNLDTMAADPNNFGRVYIGVNGRGVIVGNPASSMPAGWTDTDVNTPGNPGWATSSTPLSDGSTFNSWILEGGGAGIGGTSDQFNFASESFSGNFTLSAQVDSFNNTGGGSSAQAGIMIRGGIGASDPFAALVFTPSGQITFEWRGSSGGSVSSTSLGGVPLGSHLELVRSGNSINALYSTDGTTWHSIGGVATVTLPTSVDAGVAVTAGYNPQVDAATFSNVQIAQASTPSQLVFTKQPANSTAHTGLPSFTVSIKDQFGNVIISDTSIVTVSLSSGTPGMLYGTTSVHAVKGVATFNGIFLLKAGTYELVASDSTDAITGGPSSSFKISAGAAAKLAFAARPTNVVAGVNESPAPVVYVEDAWGNIVTTDNSLVTLGVKTGPSGSGGGIFGNFSLDASNGVATFSSVYFKLAGVYTLSANDGALTSAASQTFTVSAGAVASLAFVTNPTNAVAGQKLAPFTVQAVDQYGNAVAHASITLSASGPGGLFGTITASTGSNGIATFSSVSLHIAGSYTLTAKYNAISSAPSSSFMISPATASKLVFTKLPDGTVHGSAFSAAVSVEDTYGNVITTQNTGTITLSQGTHPSGSVLGGTLTVNVVNGVATFSNLTVTKAGSYSLKAADSFAIAGTISATFAVG